MTGSSVQADFYHWQSSAGKRTCLPKILFMRNLLLLLVGFVAITALTGGLLLTYEPDGSLLELSPSMLANSPFQTFFIPGLVLAFVVGGANLFALVVVGSRTIYSYRYAIAGAIVLISFIVLQMLFFSYYHWLQVVYIAIGCLIVLLSYQLMGKAAF